METLKAAASPAAPTAAGWGRQPDGTHAAPVCGGGGQPEQPRRGEAHAGCCARRTRWGEGASPAVVMVPVKTFANFLF